MTLKLVIGVVLAVVFLGCISILGVAWLGYKDGSKRANEAYLEASLSRMRDAIKKNIKEKGKPPQTLADLEEYTYIIADPITDKKDWTVVYYDCKGSANCIDGIKDIHSSSNAKSSKGNPYSEW
jgi:hypothetical protein